MTVPIPLQMQLTAKWIDNHYYKCKQEIACIALQSPVSTGLQLGLVYASWNTVGKTGGICDGLGQKQVSIASLYFLQTLE